MATNSWKTFLNNPRNPDAGFNTAPTTPGNRMPATRPVTPATVGAPLKGRIDDIKQWEPQVPRTPPTPAASAPATRPVRPATVLPGSNTGGMLNSNPPQQGRPEMDWLRQWRRDQPDNMAQQWQPQQQQMSFNSGYQQSPYGGQYMPPWMQYQQQPQWGGMSSYYNSMNPWGQMPFYQMQQPQMNYNNAYQQFGNQWQSPFANRPTPNYQGAWQMPVVPNLPTKQPQYTQTPWG